MRMSLQSAVTTNGRAATEPDFTMFEYKQPPKDLTVVKVQIVRGCWVALRDGEPMRSVKAGEVLQLPRWLADVLERNGKASLL